MACPTDHPEDLAEMDAGAHLYAVLGAAFVGLQAVAVILSLLG